VSGFRRTATICAVFSRYFRNVTATFGRSINRAAEFASVSHIPPLGAAETA